MRWTPCLIALLLAGCYVGPVLYPSPPDNPDLPVGENVIRVSLVLTTDGTENAFLARPVPLPAGGGPRDMDIEIMATSKLAKVAERVQFTRSANALNLPEGKRVRLRARGFVFGEFGLEHYYDDHFFRPAGPEQIVGTEFQEWSYVFADEGGTKSRIRVRFQSDHPDWEFTDAAILVAFNDGRIEAVPLFTP